MADVTPVTQADALLSDIRAKLGGKLSASDVSGLIAQVQPEIAELDRLAGVAEAEAQSYKTPTSVALDPAQNGTNLTFAAGRLRDLLASLKARQGAEEDAETQAECQKAFNAATEARDAAVTALQTEYPGLAKQMLDLVNTIKAADDTISSLKTPRGVTRLQGVEAAAGTKVLPLLNLPDLNGNVLVEMDPGEMDRMQNERFHGIQRRAFEIAQPFQSTAAFDESVARMKAANLVADQVSKRGIGGQAA